MPFLMLHVDDPGLQFADARRFLAADLPAVPPRAFDHTARRMAAGPIRLAYLSADLPTQARLRRTDRAVLDEGDLGREKARGGSRNRQVPG